MSDLAEKIEEAAPASAPAPAKRDKTVADLVLASRDQFALALAGNIDPDKFTRVAITTLRTTPKLAQCNEMSLLGAFMACAQLGLEPSGPLGHAYLVPFGKEVQLIVGYQGLIELAYRSGRVMSIVARPVHENDEFEFEYGLHDKLRHVPAPTNRGAMTHVYAVAHLAGGGVIPVVMAKVEVDAVKARSPGAKKPDSPWKSDYEAMAMKSAVRRLFKWLPSSVESHAALGADEGVVKGVASSLEELPEVIDVEGVEV